MRSRTRNMSSSLIELAVVASLVTMAGCGADEASVDKAGGDREPITVALGVADGEETPYDSALDYFVAQVDQLTHGMVQVEIVREAGGPLSRDSEQTLATMIVDGEIDLAVVPARAWDDVGVGTFRALQVPFLVDSDELFAAITRSDVAVSMLAGLDAVGVTGLVMFPESLRHPVGFERAYVSASDFAGAQLRWNASPVAMSVAAALGVEPVFPGQSPGELDGADSAFNWLDTLPVWGGPVTANIPLYAKAQTIVANSDWFGSLPHDIREALQQAAEETLTHAIVTTVPERERALAYCADGGNVAIASDVEIAELTTKIEPVVAELVADPATAEVVAGISALKSELDPPTAIEPCRSSSGDEAAADAEFPEGLYRTDSPSDGVVMMGYVAGEWTRYFEDGSVDCVSTYEVRDGRIYLTTSSDPQLACGNPPNHPFLDAAFSFDDGQLRLTDINSDPGAAAEFGLPWTLIEAEG